VDKELCPTGGHRLKRLLSVQAEKIKDGEELALLTIGHVGNYGIEVCASLEKEGISIAHYDLRFVKPLDEELLHEVFSKFKKIITVEDGCIEGGFGSAVLEFMADHNYFAEVKRLGAPDRVVEQGEQQELQHECGFDREGIQKAVEAMVVPMNGNR
jgi:1-deoxy-D-xylulose-5-phosphate synthase